MDWNLSRRKRERDVAQEVARQFLRELKSIAEQGAQPELLAHHFGLVCERLDFMPTEKSAERVLNYALKEIGRVHRKVDIIAAQLQF